MSVVRTVCYILDIFIHQFFVICIMYMTNYHSITACTNKRLEDTRKVFFSIANHPPNNLPRQPQFSRQEHSVPLLYYSFTAQQLFRKEPWQDHNFIPADASSSIDGVTAAPSKGSGNDSSASSIQGFSISSATKATGPSVPVV